MRFTGSSRSSRRWFAASDRCPNCGAEITLDDSNQRPESSEDETLLQPGDGQPFDEDRTLLDTPGDPDSWSDETILETADEEAGTILVTDDLDDSSPPDSGSPPTGP